MSTFTSLRNLLLCAATYALFACGGGTGSTTPTGSLTPLASSLDVSSSTTQLDSSGAGSATITVTAKNTSNIAVAGVVVSFSANSGDLVITNATTNASGKAIAVISVGANKANRIITVTASSGTIVATTGVEVRGTVISVSGPSAVGLGSNVQLSASVKDASGAGIAGVPLTLSSSLGNGANKTCVPANCMTDSSGTVTITYTPTVTGADTVTLSALGATSVQTITAASSLLTISAAPDAGVSSANEFSINQTSKTITIALNAPTTNFPATITLSSTAGTVTPSSIILTAANVSNATAVLATNSSVGSGVIVATHTATNNVNIANGVSNNFPFEIVSRIPASVTLQASPNVIGSNASGSSTNKATITATVRDSVGNPVKGATVNFNKPSDASSGSLQSATAITNAAGLASTNYIAGPNAASGGGVTIGATVNGLVGVSPTTVITVAQQALYVNLGFANSLIIVNSSQYSKEFSVSVSDAAGQAVSGANVSVALLPRGFYKGEMVPGASTWVARRVEFFAPIPANNVYRLPLQCLNEDLNFNGTIQVNGSVTEDTNGNGQLDPGVRPIVTQIVGGTTPGTTDATGFAVFKITYLKQDALWSEYTVTASSSTAGGGAQGNASQSFVLPVAVNEVSDLGVSPPNAFSPFGRATGLFPACTNTQ